MIWMKSIIICLAVLVGINSCSNPDEEETIEPLVDIDGNEYRTVIVGEQEWMAENLKVTHYSDGSPINQRLGQNWLVDTLGAFAFYDDDSNNKEYFGLLYNWYSVNDPRQLAPEGWRVPFDDDWKTLEKYLGMDEAATNEFGYRGSGEGMDLKADSGWVNSGNGTNSTGFNAIPGGYISSGGGGFNGIGNWATFHSASQTTDMLVIGRILMSDSSSIYRASFERAVGISIRCIKE